MCVKLAERLTRKYGMGASCCAEENAAAHGKAGQGPALDAWPDVAARIRAGAGPEDKKEISG